MNAIKQYFGPLKPGNWTQFALGVVCLLTGIMNLVTGQWYSLAVAAFALFIAGFSVAMSITLPEMQRLSEALSNVDYKNLGKNAAESFKAHVLDMRARGEFPPDVQIIVGDEQAQPPIGRLN